MTAKAIPFPRWATSSLVDAADTAPMELERLGSHYNTCNDGRSWWFQVQCWAELVHDFLAPRIVTTLCLATGLIALTAALF